jgi:hypothetical protein
LGHLPKRLALVQITTPNNDNGLYIVNWGNELPPDVVLESLVRHRAGNLIQTLGVAWQVLRNEMHDVLSYNTALLSLVQGGRNDRVISRALCQGDTPRWLQRLPSGLRGIVGPYAGRSFYCMPHNSWLGYRHIL